MLFRASVCSRRHCAVEWVCVHFSMDILFWTLLQINHFALYREMLFKSKLLTVLGYNRFVPPDA